MSVSEVTSRASHPPPSRRSRSRPARAATSIGGRFTRPSSLVVDTASSGDAVSTKNGGAGRSPEEPADGLDGQGVAVAAEAADRGGGHRGHHGGAAPRLPAVGVRQVEL